MTETTFSYRIFIEHSQYYTGCRPPTFCGIGSTPKEAFEDALDMAWQAWEGTDNIHRISMHDTEAEAMTLPDTSDDEDVNAEDSEVYYHCEITFA